jgi:pimeloyl-ACP methyl ester carboxylesterase
MNLIILPGNSARNRDWGLAAARAYAADFAEIHNQEYQHWQSGEPAINMEAELERLTPVVAAWSEPYRIAAKSAGSLLAILGTARGLLAPERCLFAGLPLNWTEARNWSWEESLLKFTPPTVIIQNDADPYAPAATIALMVEKLQRPNLSLITTPGANHDYLDFALLNSLSDNFLTSH